MNGPDEPSARFHAARGMGQLLLYGSLGLVVAAAATLALGADDARLLRLGVLAALGSALLGAFAAAKMRREATSGADRAEDLRTIHRLELEREISARREHELTVERELRREAKEDSRDELEAVRAELRSLHENLQKLFGGELLVERVAVRAESTRFRSLPEETSPSRLRALEPAADLVVPHAGKGDAGSTERPAAPRQEPESTQHSVPPPGRPTAGPESPPLPRRDPEARTAPTRRPRPEASRSAPRSASFAEDPLFGGTPQRSSPSWTPSWPSAPRPWDPPRPWDSPRPRDSGAPADPQSPPRPQPAPSRHGEARVHSDPPTVPMAVGREHRRGVPEVPTGAHSAGRSVDDLLAAYGADSGARRRRRREDD